MTESNKVEDLWDDDEDFSHYDDWLDDINDIRTIVFDVAKSLNFVEVHLYGEYTHVISHDKKDKVLRIATKSDEHLNSDYGLSGAWDILEEALSNYPVVFTDYDYLMSGKAETGAKPDDLTMFRFGSLLLYSRDIKSREELNYVESKTDLSEMELRKILGV